MSIDWKSDFERAEEVEYRMDLLYKKQKWEKIKTCYFDKFEFDCETKRYLVRESKQNQTRKATNFKGNRHGYPIVR